MLRTLQTLWRTMANGVMASAHLTMTLRAPGRRSAGPAPGWSPPPLVRRRHVPLHGASPARMPAASAFSTSAPASTSALTEPAEVNPKP